MTPVALVLASLIGLALGLLGGGGSILTVPVFTYVLGYPPGQAVAMSLPVVGAAAAAGAAVARWRGTLPVRAALAMGPSTMAGSYAGARVAAVLAGRTQMLVLAVVMLAAAASLWQRARGRRPMREARAPHPGLVALVGLGVGLLTGVVGVGGGFLIVPALVLAGGLPMREATGASLLVIAFGTTAGLAGYLGRTDLDWPIVGVFAGVAAAGSVAGGILASHVPVPRLQQAFAALLAVLAVYILGRG